MINPCVDIKIFKSFFISIREDLFTLLNYLKIDVTNAYIKSKISRDIFHLGSLIDGYTKTSYIKKFFLKSLINELELLNEYAIDDGLNGYAQLVYKDIRILNQMITKYF